MKNIISKRLISSLVIFIFHISTSAQSEIKTNVLPDGIYAEINTTKGQIICQLEYEKTPMTVGNFVGLVEGNLITKDMIYDKPFYNGLKFHRVIKDFMIQGGDPDGTGSGGPKHRFYDEIHPDLKHDGSGILSMANGGPITNGSQFFITHKVTAWLDGKNTVFGHVVKGQNVVDAIEQNDVMTTVVIKRIGKAALEWDASKAFNETFIQYNILNKGLYDEVYAFQEGMAAVKLNDKFGFIDLTGKEVIPLKYEAAGDFLEGLAPVYLKEKIGFIDKTGKEVIPLKYDYLSDFHEGLASVRQNNKWGFIDKTGKEVIPCKYNLAADFSEGLASVDLKNKWGFIDKTGKVVIPIIYDDVRSFNEGLASVTLNDKSGFIDNTGKVVIPLIYESAGLFNEGLAVVGKNGYYGCIDKTGNEIIPFKYESFNRYFKEGLLAVKLNDLWGYIDKTGKEIIPFKYQFAGTFDNGVALVEVSQENYIEINKKGECVKYCEKLD